MIVKATRQGQACRRGTSQGKPSAAFEQVCPCMPSIVLVSRLLGIMK